MHEVVEARSRWARVPGDRRLVALGIAFLALGASIYLAVRPLGAATGLLGIVVGSFPTFAHVVGFSLLTIGLLRLSAPADPLIVGSWLLINLAFEAGQRAPWASGTVVPGVFDVRDLGAMAVAALASLLILTLHRRAGGTST